ncbi:MAG: MMPL family transporter, partial [Gammaproteobacteria bacterium]|nr:MMPL family transporter [Gammaproteobacteria bacterium]
MAHVEQSDLPIISDLNEFDYDSGTFLEKLVFNNRRTVMALCALVTVVLGFFAVQIELKAGFEKTLPKAHQFVINYNDNRENLKGLGNNLRMVVAVKEGTIFTKENLKYFEEVNEAIFFIPGVNRNGMKSLFTPNTRWRVVTEEGFEGGPVIPGDFDGSDRSIAEVKRNILRAGISGDLVANDEKSAAIIIPLMDRHPETGERLDYAELSDTLEEIREKFTEGDDNRSIHIIGFAKLIGDLIEGLFSVMLFFAVAVVIATLLLYWYTRCFRSTVLVIACTLVAVMWQLGILALLGYELDPFSILVPFLVFAIGVSHGAQKLNGVLQDIGRGTHRYIAARYTFRRLFLAGVTALLSDGVGFAVLMIIQIQVIQDLAITASIGVLVLIFTNLILTPILLSYTGVGRKCAERASRPVKSMEEMHIMWRFLLAFTKPGPAAAAIAVSVVLAGIGLYVAQDLAIGDLDKGAPELRADSRYNQDVAYMVENYSVSTDVFAVIIKTDPDGCIDHEGLSLANELEWRLRQVEGVEDVRGLNVRTREIMMGINEGFPKWQSLFRNQDTVNYAVSELVTLEYVDPGCSIWPMLIYLADHKAATLTRVVETLDQFTADWGEIEKIEFMGAAGSSGFEAATNIVVKKANREMLFYVYGAVIMLCMLTFRS